MIKLTQLATLFETGLNARLNDPEIQFKIWATAGQQTPSIRSGNSITYYLDGDLQVNSSANEANLLVMGVNQLRLMMYVPVKRPRTNAQQKAEELERIKNGQYPFLELITNAVDNYFKSSQAIEIIDEEETDESGKPVVYSVGIKGNTALSGIVDIVSELDECVILSVYIECFFVAGGINSRDVQISIDGHIVPFQSVNVARSNELSTDVYAGEMVKKNITTATAFSLEISFPSNSDYTTKAVLDYLLNAKPNVAHFIKIKWGKTSEIIFFMTFDRLSTSVQGISFAGVSFALVEVIDNVELIDVPDQFQVGRFIFDNSQTSSVLFTIDECTLFMAGKAREIAGNNTITVTPRDYVYDAQKDKYYIYAITDRAVNILPGNASFEIVKEAVLDG